MATAAKFPTAALALTDVFGELPNFPPLTLNGAINASVTSIVVNEAIPAAWPQISWITVDQEVMRVTSYNAGTKTFTVAARDASAGNAQSTTAASHVSGAYLFVSLTAQQWNQAVAEIIAIETQAGLGFYGEDAVGRWAYHWSGQLGGSSAVTGTGSISAPTAASAGTNYIIQTGATSGSTVGVVRTIGVGNINGVGKVRLLRFVVTWSQLDANTNSAVYLTDEGGTGTPSATARHIGIRQAGAVFNFSTADNTTEQTTDITAFMAAAVLMIDITYDGTTARCYINGTLRATHATNVPASVATQPSIKFYLTNTAAANKRLDIDLVDAVFAD